MEPEDSLIMGNEDLRIIPEKESDEFIKSSVEDLVPIPRESEDTSDSDKESDLPFCNNSVTFSNPLFDANDDFTSSDDESLPEEDVQEENFKIYSNPLFEFDEEYISSDINPLYNEVLEDIENKDSYVSNLDEPALLVTPFSDANEDECFDPGGDIDEIDAFLDIDVSTDIEDSYHDSEGDVIYLERLLTNDTTHNLPPRIFLPYLTYSMDSSLLLSSGSEDIIFDFGISVFSCYSLGPVVSHRSGTFMYYGLENTSKLVFGRKKLGLLQTSSINGLIAANFWSKKVVLRRTFLSSKDSSTSDLLANTVITLLAEHWEHSRRVDINRTQGLSFLHIR
ncbi:hypothetical protein Tco_1167072 [Tanacetum coccineum]